MQRWRRYVLPRSVKAGPHFNILMPVSEIVTKHSERTGHHPKVKPTSLCNWSREQEEAPVNSLHLAGIFLATNTCSFSPDKPKEDNEVRSFSKCLTCLCWWFWRHDVTPTAAAALDCLLKCKFSWSSTDDSIVKRVYCFSRGLAFSFQHPTGQFTGACNYSSRGSNIFWLMWNPHYEGSIWGWREEKRRWYNYILT